MYHSGKHHEHSVKIAVQTKWIGKYVPRIFYFLMFKYSLKAFLNFDLMDVSFFIKNLFLKIAGKWNYFRTTHVKKTNLWVKRCI